MRDFKELLERLVKAKLNHEELKLEIAREIFLAHNLFTKNNEWQKFLDDLGLNGQRQLAKLSHFYYFLFREKFQNKPEEIRDEIILITISSIIEDLMTVKKYKTFSEWYKYECSEETKGKANKKINKDKHVNFLWNEYNKVYGCRKKVINFFKGYLNKDDQKELLSSFEKYNKRSKKLEKLTRLRDLAEAIYGMRNDFIHKAKMKTFCGDNILFVGALIDGHPYSIKLQADKFVQIFEKGFINYYIDKYKSKDGQKQKKSS